MESSAFLTTCPSRREVHVWDARAGLVARSYKDCAAPPRGLAVVDAAHFVAAQVGRPQLHVYSWAREQPIFRCQTPEELRALTCTSDGAYCVGGGVSGRLYLWATRTGSLLLAWDAHFKSVGALALAPDDGLLLVGGADALVTVWSLADALAAAEADTAAASVGAGGGRARAPAGAPLPVWTWSAHALAVTAVAVGATCPGTLAVSASLDQTVHVRELAHGELLHVLRAPSAVHSVALSRCEHELFAGTADGHVLRASLVLHAQQAEAPGGALKAGGAGGFGAASGGDAAGGGWDGGGPFGSHGAIVHGVLVLGAGGTIASCGADGTLRAWDVRSRQQLSRMSAPHAHGAFEALLEVAWPPAPAGAGGAGAAGALPVLPFKKYMDVGGGGAGSVGGGQAAGGSGELSALLGCALARPAVRGAAPAALPPGGWGAEADGWAGATPAREPSAGRGAEEEVQALRESVRQWQAVANELYGVAVADLIDDLSAADAQAGLALG